MINPDGVARFRARQAAAVEKTQAVAALVGVVVVAGIGAAVVWSVSGKKGKAS